MKDNFEQNKLVALAMIDNKIDGLTKEYKEAYIQKLDDKAPSIKIGMTGAFRLITPIRLNAENIKIFNKQLFANSYRIPSEKQLGGRYRSSEQLFKNISFTDKETILDILKNGRRSKIEYHHSTLSELKMFNHFKEVGFIKDCEMISENIESKISDFDMRFPLTDTSLYSCPIQSREHSSSETAQYEVSGWYFVCKKSQENPDEFTAYYLVRSYNETQFWNYPNDEVIRDRITSHNKIIEVMKANNYQLELKWIDYDFFNNDFEKENSHKGHFLRDDERFKDKLKLVPNPEYEPNEVNKWGFLSKQYWGETEAEMLVKIK